MTPTQFTRFRDWLGTSAGSSRRSSASWKPCWAAGTG